MAGDCERARAVRWLALPIADAAGLTAAAAVNGAGREVRGRVLCALYLVAVLARTAATVLRGIWAAGEPEDRRGARAGGGETR